MNTVNVKFRQAKQPDLNDAIMNKWDFPDTLP